MYQTLPTGTSPLHYTYSQKEMKIFNSLSFKTGITIILAPLINIFKVATQENSTSGNSRGGKNFSFLLSSCNAVEQSEY